jgi:cytochrome c nitrite reductase small subunit
MIPPMRHLLRTVIATHPPWVTVVCVAIGVLAGVGAYTFYYAEGFSYVSNDPRVCVNCHIMNDQFDSWQKGSHHGAATCVDCHLPHDLVGKYMAKGKNGWNHSRAFTLQNFPEPIRITRGNLDILQQNCIRCHREMVDAIASPSDVGAGRARCTVCHRSAGHMQLD